jgi:hypothetical protein
MSSSALTYADAMQRYRTRRMLDRIKVNTDVLSSAFNQAAPVAPVDHLAGFRSQVQARFPSGGVEGAGCHRRRCPSRHRRRGGEIVSRLSPRSYRGGEIVSRLSPRLNRSGGARIGGVRLGGMSIVGHHPPRVVTRRRGH